MPRRSNRTQAERGKRSPSSNDKIHFFPVGGYSEFGRNMTAVEVDGEAVIFDMGIKLDRVMIHEDVVFDETHHLDLQKLGAIPDDASLDKLRGKVKAIILTHGHLDHIGAIPKLAYKYKAPIYCTPYTAKLAQDELTWERVHKEKVEVKSTPMGPIVPISRKLSVEFVKTTHSIVDSSMACLHTPMGEILYCNDFKFDNSPVIGTPPDYKRLKELGSGKGESGRGVALAIIETTRAHEETKAESESIARAMVKDYITGLESAGRGLVVTTFSSHIERLKSIIDYGQKIGREIVLLGRSMEKYSRFAEELGYAPFVSDVMVRGDRREIEKTMRSVMKDGKDNYLLVVTGHQGEPDAILSRMARGETPYQFERNDHVVFSSKVIPHPQNIAQFNALENRLKGKKVRLIKGAHVSGHAAAEDHKELLQMIRPVHIVPSHGDLPQTAAYLGIAEFFDYELNKNIFLARNHQNIQIGS